MGRQHIAPKGFDVRVGTQKIVNTPHPGVQAHQGHWVTTEDDQHLYISGKGEVLPRGPGTKPTRRHGPPQSEAGKARTAQLVGGLRAKMAGAKSGPDPGVIDRKFYAHQKQGWGSGMKGVSEERKDAASHARMVHAKAIENIARWKKEGPPPGTRENLAKAHVQAETALSNAKAAGALKGARAKHYATLKAVKLMERNLK